VTLLVLYSHQGIKFIHSVFEQFSQIFQPHQSVSQQENGRELLENFDETRYQNLSNLTKSQSCRVLQPRNHDMASKQGRLLALLAVTAAACLLLPSASAVEYCSEYPAASETSFAAAALGY
jgi:hypothetical protein